MDISTTSTQNAILSCATPSNSSSQSYDTPCVGLLALSCFYNNEDSSFSSACISANHVEEIKELEAKILSLKKDTSIVLRSYVT
jgi:hypothetical protein